MKVVFVLFSVSLFFCGPSLFALEKLDKRHIQTKQRFIQKNFQRDNQYAADKLYAFVAHLEKEKISLKEDLYETRLIRELEQDISGLKEAKRDALKAIKEKKNRFLLAYNEFMIPRVKQAAVLAEEGYGPETIQPLIDEFLEVYAGFYLPNAPRRVWDLDQSPVALFKSFWGYHYRRDDRNAVEASNLTVGDHVSAVSDCLGQSFSKNDFLSQKEIKELKRCHFDISLLSPPKNPLMGLERDEFLAEARNRHMDRFPSKEDKITFRKIKHSGSGSAKLIATYKRDGKKVRIKIKFGREVHSEIAVSILGKLIGLHQDNQIHRHDIKMYLGKYDFDGFVQQWRRKYEGLNEEVETFLKDRGKDDGGEYVIFKNGSIEINDQDDLRLEGYNPAGWDLENKREHRAQVLWYSLVNMLDTKTGNHRIILKKTKKGLQAAYSLQDVGISLIASPNLRYPLKTIKGSLGYSVNWFSKSSIDWNDRRIHIWWSEVLMDKERFRTTTYADLKWMARRIAAIDYDDIVFAFKESGYPEPVADLYVHKIVHRRNDLVKAFRLEKEFDLYYVPNFKTYSPNKHIKNGKLVTKSFKGFSQYHGTQLSFAPAIIDTFTRLIPIQWIRENFQLKVKSSIDLHSRENIVLWDGHRGKNIIFRRLNGGVALDIKRRVERNNAFHVRDDGKTDAFIVRDILTIQFSLHSGLITTIGDHLPLHVGAHLRAYRKEIEFTHFASSWMGGYLKPLQLNKILRAFRKDVLFSLGPGEVMRLQDYYGMSLSSRLSFPQVSEPLRVTAGVSWQRSKPVFFGRDYMDGVFIYREKNDNYRFSFGLEFGLVDLYLIDFPIIGLHYKVVQYKYESSLYRFHLRRQHEFETVPEQVRRKSEDQVLGRFLAGDDESPSILGRRQFAVDGQARVHHKRLSLLNFLRKEKKIGHASFKIIDKNGKVDHFYRSWYFKGKLFGDDDDFVYLNSPLAVVAEDQTTYSVELKNEDYKKSLIVVRRGIFKRKMKKKKLQKHIGKMNELYSQGRHKKFFRNYILPSSSDVPFYRKVYTDIRIFIDPNKVLEGLAKAKRKGEDYYKKVVKDVFRGKRRDNYVTIPLIGLRPVKKRLTRLLTEDLGPKKYTETWIKVLRKMKWDRNTLRYMKRYFGEDSFFIYGEIHGIYPSFTPLQQDDATTARRFTGKSWGELDHSPPFWKFLKAHHLAPLRVFVTNSAFVHSMLGDLPAAAGIDYY